MSLNPDILAFVTKSRFHHYFVISIGAIGYNDQLLYQVRFHHNKMDNVSLIKTLSMDECSYLGSADYVCCNSNDTLAIH